MKITINIRRMYQYVRETRILIKIHTESHPDIGLGNLICSNCGGTVIQWRPRATKASASSIPNPYARLTKIPALFLVNEALGEREGLEVYTTKY